MGNLPLQQSVAVVFCGALAFGLYFATLLTCLRLLFLSDDGWHFRNRIRWTTVFITLLILVFNVIYLSLSLDATMRAAAAASSGPSPKHKGTRWTNILSVRHLLSSTKEIILIYSILPSIRRCWTVYGGRYLIIIAPAFLWLGALLCTILQIYLQSINIHNPNIGPYQWASVNMTFGPGIVLLPFWMSTVLLNIYATSALIRRIYLTADTCKQIMSVTHLNLAIRIIAESGLLYLSITLAHLLAWFGQSEFAIDTISVLNAPVIGLAFNWLLIRFERTKAKNAALAIHRSIASSIHFSKSISQQSQAISNVQSTGATVAESRSQCCSQDIDIEDISAHAREVSTPP
ncbi:hypothetical protein AN958_01964 [Leucoagaricus sp. SymC.cos]|nr:hypothetical protein AN958_01964 [Leucoagaricus sp. SymC.cos]